MTEIKSEQKNVQNVKKVGFSSKENEVVIESDSEESTINHFDPSQDAVDLVDPQVAERKITIYNY